MTDTAGDDDGDSLEQLVDDLLVRDAESHADALEAIADADDPRAIPHLIEALMIHEIGSNWSKFGFPEVLREHSPPRYLELPEARWPGVREALQTVAEPDYDSEYAWVEWESWYSQQDLEPLEGFDEWKLQLYRSYLPPVGRLLDAEPRAFDLQDVRWGNCDPSFLAACNEPDFVPGDAVAKGGESGGSDGSDSDDEYERYLADGDTVFGFTIDGTAYAVPRWVLFPHELANLTVEGTPLTLSYCTLCNAPIMYDRRVDDRTLTFNNTGMLLEGNKIMFDEETESLWSQHRGVPIAGDYLESDPDLRLEIRPVTQTTWGEWRDSHPESLALDIETGYDFDYEFYEDNIGFFRHYWNDESAIQPGLETDEGALPEKTDVYGVTAADGSTIHVYPTDELESESVETDEIDGQTVVVLRDATDDIAVYEAPSTPIDRDGDSLVDDDDTRWEITHDGLVSEDGTRELPRRSGRHGLFFAFRSQYDDVVVGL
ncbi:DUF3179 domain-containing (seleno)protein [Natronolimnohabitans innermongolicus]|uniref:DUF3179 domain-containing protein n=1 Tax=Natronolimnohabitans innermongolicus JCM 12255 TaxID=1227499 RepID=L9WN89_9EURY|nr:DUF3179 domain-containing (seleno)protein [Natronolimnohabitans innermongolicus]ELY50924.1 hypothetical protein C493_18101 [Natronolimnohabitans innermongolicus JCM 12255]